jgi:type III secretory pathway component EscS
MAVLVAAVVLVILLLSLEEQAIYLLQEQRLQFLEQLLPLAGQ